VTPFASQVTQLAKLATDDIGVVGNGTGEPELYIAAVFISA